MEVILREEVDSVGRRGDVVKVAAGYARNFRLPRKLALPVNENNKRQIEREKKLGEARDMEEKSAAEAIAGRLMQLEIEIPRRVGENDTLYGSVTSAGNAQAVEDQGLHGRKRKIKPHQPPEAPGTAHL